MIWFNQRHDGITLEAVGDVVLTAANPELAEAKAPSAPAVVNHVVYFGDGITRNTVMRGFRITGANNFTTGTGEQSPIESDEIRKTAFFYTDGGGIKVYARSYPTIEHVEVFDNYASPCGGGISVEHLGQVQESVLLRNCIIRNNRTQTTGGGVDLLHGSHATIENCLFVGNLSNLGVDYVGLLTGGEYHPEHGSGAMTVFAGSTATVSNCTFTGNWSGVDDDGTGSTYVDSIFWKNTLTGGISQGSRYELDITDGAGVRGTFIHGDVNDLRQTVDQREEHVRSAGSALRCGVRPPGAAVREGWLPSREASGRQRPGPASPDRSLLLLDLDPRVHRERRRHGLRLPGRPRHLDFVDGCRRAKSEVERIHAVREVAGVAVEHLRVGRAAGRDLDDGAERRRGSTRVPVSLTSR